MSKINSKFLAAVALWEILANIFNQGAIVIDVFG